MANYEQLTDFSSKDSLPSGDPGKVILGADVDNELAAIATAISSKEDVSNKGVPNGYAGLNAQGKVPLSQLPLSEMAVFPFWLRYGLGTLIPGGIAGWELVTALSSTGEYVIAHPLGNENYTVQATILSHTGAANTRTIKITNRTSTTFKVLVIDDTGTLVDEELFLLIVPYSS